MVCSAGSEEMLVVSLVLNIPEPGQLVDVRQRRYVVVDVAQNVLPPDLLKSGSLNTRLQPHQFNQNQHLVTLTSVEDDALGEELQALEAQGVSEGTYRAERKKWKAEADAELEPLWQRVYRVQEQSHRESCKHERYCREQRDLLRALEDLAANERVMHELDNRKDQIMTTCKVALANLAMWVRDRFFPPTYTHATWQRLQPFFRLPGRIQRGHDTVQVQLRPFNNRQLTRDLLAVCQRVNELQPRLPDGRLLILHAPSSPFSNCISGFG
jgi:hypothetical protein